MKKIKDICTGRRFQLILGAVILVLLIIFITVYNLPANRAKRSYAKAVEQYAAGDYHGAAESYSKAIELKADMFEARKGLILSYSTFDLPLARTALKDTDALMPELLESVNEETLPTVIEIYLLAPEIFGTFETDTLISLLESGSAYTQGSPDLQPALSDAYALMAGKLVEGDIALAIDYDQKSKSIAARETGNEETIAAKLTSVIIGYIDSDNYDKAYETIDKYKSLYNIDSESLTLSADAARDLYETKVELLSSVYETMYEYYSSVTGPVDETFFAGEGPAIGGMTQFDFSTLFENDGSEAAEKLATSFTRNAYIYAPDFTSDYEGLVCGLYTYGEPYEDSEGIIRTNYYFYFGEYKNGARNGYGISFSEASATSYKGYEGEWKDDAPNGFGAACKVTGIGADGSREYTRVCYGNFENGIQSGTINVKVALGELPDMIFEGTYVSENGIGTEVPGKTDDYEILDEIPENQSLIAVLASSSDGYNIYVKILQKRTEVLSAVGF